jgi:hypothetical protein
LRVTFRPRAASAAHVPAFARLDRCNVINQIDLGDLAVPVQQCNEL